MNRKHRKPARQRATLERLEDRHYLSGLPIGTPDTAQAYGQMPLIFEPNVGQADASASFVSRGSGYSLLLAPNQVSLSLAPPGGGQAGGTELDMRLVGGNANAQSVPLDKLSSVSNYLIGDQSQWLTDVPNYGRAEFANVYPGVDMIYHGNDQQRLEYDFVLAPHADPNAIQLAFDGASGVSLDAQGDLVLHTSAGDLVENAPVVYQDINGAHQAVAGHYVLEGGDRVGFQVGAYDANQTLVIDPTYSLVYSTYLGGRGGSSGYGIAVDGSGDAYVAGVAYVGFPTLNAAQANYAGAKGVSDAFVSKLNAAGTGLVYSTYLGGSGTDVADGIALRTDPITHQTYAYVSGHTYSTNFPTTAGAFSRTLAGSEDNFMAELNPAGNSLLYSSYLGAGNSYGGIAVDSSGDAYVTGESAALVMKINPALSGAASLVYSYGVGGMGAGDGIAVDAAGDAYVTGRAFSSSYPVTPGAFESVFDASFVTEVNPAGTGMVYSTFLGGGAQVRLVRSTAIAIDGAGDAYVVGQAVAPGLATTPGAFQTTLPGNAGAFMSELNPTGTGLVYSTYLGGSGSLGNGDQGNAVAVDTSGHVYVTGESFSSDFPTLNAFQPAPTLAAGQSAAFVAEFDPSQAGAASLVYSSYLGGGNTVASGQGIAVDGAGNAYVTGYTAGPFPTTPGAFQPNDPASGGHPPLEAFVTKIDPPAAAQAVVGGSAQTVAPTGPAIPASAVDALFSQQVDQPASSANQTSIESRLTAARKATDAVFANWGDV